MCISCFAEWINTQETCSHTWTSLHAAVANKIMGSFSTFNCHLPTYLKSLTCKSQKQQSKVKTEEALEYWKYYEAI